MFKDINLKFAIISCLNNEGFYINEAKNIKLKASNKLFFQRLSYDDIVPEVYIYYKDLEIEPDNLGIIKEFNPSASNECYNFLVKEWSGEDDIFNIKSLNGIEYLSNLTTFKPYGLLDYNVDIKALLKCKNLKTVHQEFIPKTDTNKKVIEKLKEKGVLLIS